MASGRALFLPQQQLSRAGRRGDANAVKSGNVTVCLGPGVGWVGDGIHGCWWSGRRDINARCGEPGTEEGSRSQRDGDALMNVAQRTPSDVAW